MLNVANREYESKVQSGSGDSKRLHALGWKVEELARLNHEGRHIITELVVLKDNLSRSPVTGLNPKIYSVGNSLTSFIKGERMLYIVLNFVHCQLS